ncbi:hypothetical protein IOD14_01440 [Streptomyces sp. A2-16]|uniref:hypothetical protein n=1 Tax=Streptomyces sp. A2-16 TaxID=2781734 RepID=UPI001BB07810|nr:hypothetical protein [Streptomyces sp. A2-16]QUC55560.1 hypothetical protein IOD14_01440 [Streptomyces sp. A2-16]
MAVIYVDEAPNSVMMAAAKALENGRRVFVYEFSEAHTEAERKTTLAEAIDAVEELDWQLDHLVSAGQSRSVEGSGTMILCLFRRK